MIQLKKSLLLFFVVLTSIVNAQDQERFEAIERQLKEVAKTTPGLNEKVELSVNGVSIQEFTRGIAIANNLNISIDGKLTAKVVNNFTNVTVADVLLFLCKKYDLEMTFIGNIMSLGQYTPPAKPKKKHVAKVINIKYNTKDSLLTMDLSNDSISLVAKKLTKLSNKNVVFSPELAGKKVSGYIQDMPFDGAMEKFAFANDLKVTPTEDDFYLLEKNDAPTTSSNNKKGKNKKGKRSNADGLEVKVDENKLISIDAANTSLLDILLTVEDKLKNDFYLYDEPKGNTTLRIENSNLDDFLTLLFNGTDYTYKKTGEIYLFGERDMERLRLTKVIPLQYRSVENVIDFIPSSLKKNVDVKPFVDQNSLILSGSERQIEELAVFLREIDRVVPVIAIEVIIIDVNNSHAVSTGIKAGLGAEPVTTQGDLFPSLDFAMGANTINSIISGINGLGVVNLGKVTPNFYLSLQAMETNGSVKINSTPLLSTLNGHEATMSISETRYYAEQNSNVIATQNTTTVNTIQYKPLTADFSLVVKPIVSGDEQITLEIAVKKQSFTSRTAGENGPFGTSTRDFKSLIRVKNQEMIMLGGLDEEVKDQSGTGVPLLSRIPIIKWFFSSRSKSKTTSKLTIFIKPTVIY